MLGRLCSITSKACGASDVKFIHPKLIPESQFLLIEFLSNHGRCKCKLGMFRHLMGYPLGYHNAFWVPILWAVDQWYNSTPTGCPSTINLNENGSPITPGGTLNDDWYPKSATPFSASFSTWGVVLSKIVMPKVWVSWSVLYWAITWNLNPWAKTFQNAFEASYSMGCKVLWPFTW